MKILSGLIIVLLVTFVLVLSYLAGRLGSFNRASHNWKMCKEYEQSGSIKTGSCKCALILFPDFANSYDWMDACEILELKGKLK